MQNFGNKDALTLAFLALREGKATPKEQQLFYDACQKKASYFMRNYKGNLDSDELLSTFVAKVWEKRDSFDPDKAGFSTWIENICWSVRSNLYGRYQTNMRHGLHSLDMHCKEGTDEVCGYDFLEDKKSYSPEKELVLKEMEDEIDEFLLDMSSNQRAAIETIYYKGLKPAEACKLLGRKPNDFYNDHNRALANLRKKFEADGVVVEDIFRIIDDRVQVVA